MSGALVSAAGRPRSFLLIETMSAVIGALLLLALAPFGIIWIAAAIVLRESAAIALYAVWLHRVLRVTI